MRDSRKTQKIKQKNQKGIIMHKPSNKLIEISKVKYPKLKLILIKNTLINYNMVPLLLIQSLSINGVIFPMQAKSNKYK